jgi:hypothetical protein
MPPPPPPLRCRYSRGGYAVRHQYGSVVRLVKQARHEGRKGASYVELVSQALAALPNRQVCASAAGDKPFNPGGGEREVHASCVVPPAQAASGTSGTRSSALARAPALPFFACCALWYV